MARAVLTERGPVILWSPSRERAEQDCACPDAGLAPVARVSRADQELETDCACPGNGSWPPPSTIMDTSVPWQQAPDLYRTPLTEGHTLCLNPSGPTGIAVLNRAALAVLSAFAQPRPLDRAIGVVSHVATADVSAAAAQLAQLGMLRPAGSVSDLCPPSPRALTAWLHVTNACNLNCTYCYLERSDQAMDEATGRAALDAVFRSAVRHGFRAVKLKYAGGEPTLHFDLVRALHRYARQLAERKDVVLRESLLSNGVALDDSMLDFVRDTGMRLVISLDGLGSGRDVGRPSVEGSDSSGLVTQKIDRALARGVKPYLSITVTGRNADQVAAVVAFALDRDLLFNLNFCRESDRTATHGDLAAEDTRLIAGMRAAFQAIEERLPSHPLISTLVDRASFNAPHCHACGAGRNYLVVDPGGRVARCQMEIERPVTTVHAQDPLTAVRQHADGFQNVRVEEKTGCGTCTWRYWCAGGCPLLTFRTTGRSDGPTPYCRVYQALFPELVRLEGLRLLKWH